MHALIPRLPTVDRVPNLSFVTLVTLEYSRGVINPLYHCRYSARDRQ